MFKSTQIRQGECRVCETPIDDEDSASFMSIDERLQEMHQPLIVLFFANNQERNSKSPEKLCKDCFKQFSQVAEFYRKCKNSRNQYTPCFRGSTASDSAETFRILSTETPDLSSSSAFPSSAYPSNSRTVSGPTPISSSELLSPAARSCSSQTVSHGECQSTVPVVKKRYPTHIDLGIKLPRPIETHKGCFDPDDYCYEMLLDEYEAQAEADKQTISRQILKSCVRNQPPISSLVETNLPHAHPHYQHITSCPYCDHSVPTSHGYLK